jgi:hypothetical protein
MIRKLDLGKSYGKMGLDMGPQGGAREVRQRKLEL